MSELPEAKVVVRASEPEDVMRTTMVQWSVGWRQPSVYHRIWPEAEAEWVEQHYYREFVAEVDGVIAARVGLEAYRQPFAELIDLCVRPEYRRMGLAEQLTRTCEREASRRGFMGIFLQTELDNTPAHHLYTNLGFVPTAHGKMLRLFKFIDYPLLAEFRRTHPLNQYACDPADNTGRVWNLEWNAYVSKDSLRLRLEGGASKSESDGIGPALTAFDWCVGARALSVRIEPETAQDIEPGDHVELTVTLKNHGSQPESGLFKMLMPFGVGVSSPATNRERVFLWEAQPGEEVVQPIVVQLEPIFDNSVLYHLNYQSLPICMETYWEGHRALLSVNLSTAAPPP